MKHIESVINCGLFDNLNKREYINAFEQLQIECRKYNKGETIFYEGEKIYNICVVEKGSVFGEKKFSNGDVHITQLFVEDSIFALEVAFSKTKKAPIDYISNEDSSVIFISVKSLRQSDYTECLMSTLIYKLADENIKLANKAEILAERGLRDRILVYLNILRSKSGTNAVSVRMNREQLAQFLCVNRSALSNELSKMKQEGIIDFKRDKFVIK